MNTGPEAETIFLQAQQLVAGQRAEAWKEKYFLQCVEKARRSVKDGR